MHSGQILKTTVILGTSIIFFFLPFTVSSLSDSEILLDRSIKTEEKDFTLNNEIIIVPIFSKSVEKLDIPFYEWFKGIYYYTIQRLGYNDIPFHYVVSKDGDTIKGNDSGLEAQLPISDFSSNGIVVAYLTDSKSTSFSESSIKSLTELLTDLCNQAAISPRAITLSGLKIERDKKNQTVKTVSSEIYGSWGSSLEEIKAKVLANYSPIRKNYRVDIIETTQPEGEQMAGGESVASIKIRNSGEFGIYGGTDTALYLTKSDGSASRFYLNTVWASQSQLLLIQDNQKILPGEELTVELPLKIPLFPGRFAETFTLSNQAGQGVETNGTEVSVQIASAGKQIVEISNAYGEAFNVRALPSTSSEILKIVSAGERFFLVEENLETLWTKIDLLDGRSGWIARWHLRFI